MSNEYINSRTFYFNNYNLVLTPLLFKGASHPIITAHKLAHTTSTSYCVLCRERSLASACKFYIS